MEGEVPLWVLISPYPPPPPIQLRNLKMPNVHDVGGIYENAFHYFLRRVCYFVSCW